MPTLLNYDLVTEPFPLQASPVEGTPVTARLTVVASNPNADPEKNPVTLQGLTVTIPVGPEAASLTVVAERVVVPVAPEGWDVNPKFGTGKADYVFTPKPGKGVVGRQGLAFTFNNIQVNKQPGPCQIGLKEGTAGSPTGQLRVTKFPNRWGEVAFWLEPPVVPFKSGTRLNWVGPAGATYTIQYALDRRIVNVPAQGEPALGSRGQYPALREPPLALEGTTVFTLSVEESIVGVKYQAQVQKTATVLMPPPHIVSFAASPSRLNPSGDTSVTLSWKTENVSDVNIAGHPFSKMPEGTWVATLREPKSFLAQAYGIEGYSGPPAYASACVGHMVSTPLLNALSTARVPEPIWSFTARNGTPLFTLYRYTRDERGAGQPLPEWIRTFWLVTLVPAPGVKVADLGKVRGAVGSDELSKATYRDSLPEPFLTWVWFDTYNPKSSSRETPKLSVGNSWAFKSPDGSLTLVWLENAKSQWDQPNGYWSYDFIWLDFSKLMKVATRTDSAAKEG